MIKIPAKAVADMRYLLSQGYEKNQVLTWVGNKYQLSKDQRQLLNRSICAPETAKKRQKKKQGLWRLRGSILGIDGHNVLITVESALKNRILLLADDGFIRDIAGVSASYRPSKTTYKALKVILTLLSLYKPTQIDWYYDAPLSRSGELAATTRKFLKACGLKGKAEAVPVPERFLSAYPLVATSDGALIDICSEVIDLAGEVINFSKLTKQPILRLKKLPSEREYWARKNEKIML